MENIERVRLIDLPIATIYHTISMLLEPSEFAALSSTCAYLNVMFSYDRYWLEYALKKFVAPRGLLYPPLELCHSVVQATCTSEYNTARPLIVAALDSSSQDQECESPENTLKYSHCYREICSLSSKSEAYVCYLSQVNCGCSFGNSCYWSSSGSKDGTSAREFISYELERGISAITEFEVIPYTSYFQPESPTYAPVSVRLSLCHPGLGEAPYYSSPLFPVENSMTKQRFSLEIPAIFVGEGYARIEFEGMQQRQTLGEGYEDYYTCITFVGIYGHKLFADISFDPDRWLFERKVFVKIFSRSTSMVSCLSVDQRMSAADLYEKFSEGNFDNSNVETMPKLVDQNGKVLSRDGTIADHGVPDNMHLCLSAMAADPL